MTLIEEIQEFFGTKDLYEVIGASKSSSINEIKKAYRRASLKIHPDRVGENDKEHATKRFQALAQVHFVLSDEERKNLYDQHGIIANEDSLDSEADWLDYWRLLFPKITEEDIKKFIDNYSGSAEEEEDLIKLYNRFEGDMDKISETHISYDETNTTEHINRLIKSGQLKEFKKFTKESMTKKSRRAKRAEREAKEAEEALREMRERSGTEDSSIDDLRSMIQKRSQNNFESMIANLEAKYAGKSKKGVKRKRADK